MGLYEQKTKEELLIIVENLEKKVEKLSSELSSLKTGRFREKYSTRILDALPDMLTVFDHDANIVELASSPATNHVEGTDSGSIVGSNVKDIVPEEAYDSVRKNMDKVIATGQGSIAKHSLMLDGVLHHYENRIFPLDEKYLLCMCRDVSEKVKAEVLNASQRNEIIRLNSLMHAILNNVPVYLFVKDTGDNFRYLYWNRAFAEQTGIAVEVAVGKTDIEIFPNSEEARWFRAGDFAVMQTGRMEYLEEYTTLSGDIRMVTMIKTLVPSGNEHPYIIGVGWDVTDIKKVEKELIKARIKAEEADKLKSSFLANMSHEIRTPLNAIVGFSHLLIDTKDKEEREQYIKIVDENTELLLQLISDILDLSKIESGIFKFVENDIDINQLCNEIVYSLCVKASEGVELCFTEQLPDCHLWTDKIRLMQVISNFINNALKFTHSGTVSLGYEKIGDNLKFYVRDTGIGIPADKLDSIFDRFIKLNTFIHGTGLGLSICKSIVEQMNGKIGVESKEGEGSCFWFIIPHTFPPCS